MRGVFVGSVVSCAVQWVENIRFIPFHRHARSRAASFADGLWMVLGALCRQPAYVSLLLAACVHFNSETHSISRCTFPKRRRPAQSTATTLSEAVAEITSSAVMLYSILGSFTETSCSVKLILQPAMVLNINRNRYLPQRCTSTHIILFSYIMRFSNAAELYEGVRIMGSATVVEMFGCRNLKKKIKMLF